MKKIVRKNQVIITALALLIAVAGYVSYTRNNVGKETAGSADTADVYDISDTDVAQEIQTDQDADGDTSKDSIKENVNESANKSTSKDTKESAKETTPGETVLTSKTETADFAAQTKLNREQVRSKNKETLLDLINNKTITEAQKQDAIQKMIQMTDISERENAAEILLEAKGFTDVVVSITDNSADVVLDMGDVTDAKRAQVEDIMKRKTGISAENIVITPVKK